MRIQIQTEDNRLFSIHSDSKLTIIIYNMLSQKLYCQVTELVSNMGLIKAKLPLNKSINDVINVLHGQFGGSISKLEDSLLITDEEEKSN